jgi:hypothetical protein
VFFNSLATKPTAAPARRAKALSGKARRNSETVVRAASN